MIVVLLDVIMGSQAAAVPVPVHLVVFTNQAVAEPVLALEVATICLEAAPVPVRLAVSINLVVAVPVLAMAAVSICQAAELVPVQRAAVIRRVHLNINFFDFIEFHYLKYTYIFGGWGFNFFYG